MLLRWFTLASLTAAAFACVAAVPHLDGATIANSGSTNAPGWSLTLRSDGKGSVDGRRFTVPLPLAQRFFADVTAARGAAIAGRPCMKSVSFGTRLTVSWHGWISPDLSCPAGSQSAAALGQDVFRIVQIAQPPQGLRRMRLPLEPHRAPTAQPRPATPDAKGRARRPPKSVRP